LGVRDALDVPGGLDGPDVLRQLRAADVFVLPSVQDAFTVSVLEAMSVGTPVVITATTGLAPDVAGAGAGRVVKSPLDIAGAVLELLDPAANEKASLAAWDLVRRRFTLDAVVGELLGIYEGLEHRR
ncbi:glycosyltransferase family 4 protein, partial [Streptomyces xiamenensis]